MAESESNRPPNMVDKIVTSLKSAKTDTEKFAALLLVPRLIKADECEAEQRREVFDAIGFPFLIRYLHFTYCFFLEKSDEKTCNIRFLKLTDLFL